MNFPTNIRITVLRRANVTKRGPGFYKPWPMSSIEARAECVSIVGGTRRDPRLVTDNAAERRRA